MNPGIKLTTCGFCSTGCNFRITTDTEGEIKLAPTPDYPVNRGSSCPKGFLHLEPLKATDRARSPLLRNTAGELEPVSWDTAMNAFVSNFKHIQKKYGRESIAFLGTGQLPTEELAFLGCLTKFGMGLIHGDGNTRQCMATTAKAYKLSFGFDAPPFTYHDYEASDVLVFIGANPVIAHPVMWNRVKKNAHNPQILLIDPRNTETAEKATRHFPIAPDSLLTLLYGIAHILIVNGWLDNAHIEKSTIGFEAFQEQVTAFDPEKVSEKTGLAKADILELTRIIHNGKRVSFWWTMGVNQNYQAVACAQAVINLALMTGNIGRPGTGANSITGQANAMGSRLFSNTTALFGGYDFLNPEHRRKVAGLLGIDTSLIPDKNSLAYDQILKGIQKGEIKGLWIICTNPLHSWINRSWLRETLKNLEYLVVQDMYDDTHTAKQADLILAAGACGEKEGTFINSERRLSVIRKIMDPPGQALTDFEIFRRIALAWGCGDLFKDWSTPAAVFEIMKRVSKGQPCDITGIRDYDMIEQSGGIQWPCPQGLDSFAQERRLYEDEKYFHDDGKARFAFTGIEPAPESPDEAYPFVLLTGRGTVVQWHTQTRTDKVDMLKKMHPAEVYVDIHSLDAARLGIEQGQWTLVRSRRGEIHARASIGEKVRPGNVFMPMHYFETNELTFPFFDPVSHEPSYKYAAVNLEPA
jgi:assimilatory nitrate reductase catalytic subunit